MRGCPAMKTNAMITKKRTFHYNLNQILNQLRREDFNLQSPQSNLLTFIKESLRNAATKIWIEETVTFSTPFTRWTSTTCSIVKPCSLYGFKLISCTRRDTKKPNFTYAYNLITLNDFWCRYREKKKRK